MKRKIISALIGSVIGILPLVVIRLPLQSQLEDILRFGVMALSMPGIWVGIVATRRVDVNFWIAVPINTVLYGCLTYFILNAIARRKAGRTPLVSPTTNN
jgi:hypothetical protein